MNFNENFQPDFEIIQRNQRVKAGLVNLRNFYLEEKKKCVLFPSSLNYTVKIDHVKNGNSIMYYDQMVKVISRFDDLQVYFGMAISGIIKDETGFGIFDPEAIRFLETCQNPDLLIMEYKSTTKVQKIITELKLKLVNLI